MKNKEYVLVIFICGNCIEYEGDKSDLRFKLLSKFGILDFCYI